MRHGRVARSQLGIRSLETGALHGDQVIRNTFLQKLYITWELARNTVSGPTLALLRFKKPGDSYACSHLRSIGLENQRPSETEL